MVKAGLTGVTAFDTGNREQSLACKIGVMHVPVCLCVLFLRGRDAWDNLTRLELYHWLSCSMTELSLRPCHTGNIAVLHPCPSL